jgi:hypothetical protein
LISKLDQKIEKSNFLVRTVKSSHDVAIGLFFDKIPFSLFLMSRFRQKSPNHDSKTEKVNFIPFSTPTTFPGFYRPKIPPKFSWGASRLAHSETRARSQGGFGPRGAREKLFFFHVAFLLIVVSVSFWGNLMTLQFGRGRCQCVEFTIW